MEANRAFFPCQFKIGHIATWTTKYFARVDNVKLRLLVESDTWTSERQHLPVVRELA